MKFISENPRHPGLQTHEIEALTKRYGRKVWQSYLENNTPAAGRVFWVYGPADNEITIIGLEPHPNDKGNAYNINGDTAAACIAGALKAETFILMTDVPGILRDKDDDKTLIPAVTVSETKQLKEEGVIAGGMLPKVKCCEDAIEKGVKNVIIMDGRVPHSILMELLTDEGAGTMVTGE